MSDGIYMMSQDIKRMAQKQKKETGAAEKQSTDTDTHGPDSGQIIATVSQDQVESPFFQTGYKTGIPRERAAGLSEGKSTRAKEKQMSRHENIAQVGRSDRSGNQTRDDTLETACMYGHAVDEAGSWFCPRHKVAVAVAVAKGAARDSIDSGMCRLSPLLQAPLLALTRNRKAT